MFAQIPFLQNHKQKYEVVMEKLSNLNLDTESTVLLHQYSNYRHWKKIMIKVIFVVGLPERYRNESAIHN